MPNLHAVSSYCIFELIYIYSSAYLTEESKEKAFEILKKAKEENIWDSRDPEGLVNAVTYAVTYVTHIIETRKAMRL